MPIRFLMLVMTAFALAGCNGSSDPVQPNPNANDINLTAGNRFSPADITIDPGTTVRWISSTSTPHTITPNDPQQPGVWSRVETASTGVVLTHTFTVSGQTYNYHCEPHLAEGMTGIIRVR